MTQRFDYVTVGHVTCDAIEGPTGGSVSQPGGGTFYSALQAARLGLRTLIVTQGAPDEIETLLAPYLGELTLRVIAAARTTTLATRGTGVDRSQRVLAWAGAIEEPLELDTAILHFAPVARETPASFAGHAGFVGVTPQGLIRAWETPGEVPLVQLDSSALIDGVPTAPLVASAVPGELSAGELDPALLPRAFDAAVISEQECAHCHPLFAAARRHGACVAVTAGGRPTTVHLGGAGSGPRVLQTAAPPLATVRDDLGAGDVFAAAFFVTLTEGRDAPEAAAFANAAAAFRIAGVGAEAIGSRVEIEALARDGEPRAER